MNLSFRRAVQARFAGRLTDDEIAAIDALNRRVDPIDTNGPDGTNGTNGPA